MLMVYNITLLSGTAYLIIQYNWSTWWFLLTVMLLGSDKREKKEVNSNGNKEA
jgi:hypothetical protein